MIIRLSEKLVFTVRISPLPDVRLTKIGYHASCVTRILFLWVLKYHKWERRE